MFECPHTLWEVSILSQTLCTASCVNTYYGCHEADIVWFLSLRSDTQHIDRRPEHVFLL